MTEHRTNVFPAAVATGAVTLLFATASLAGTAAAGSASLRHGVTRAVSPHLAVGSREGAQRRSVMRADLDLGSAVIDLLDSDPVSVRGITAHSVEVRLLGAIGGPLAYQATPYRWQRLRLVHHAWRGALPAPGLLGIYQLQLRLDHGRRFLTSTDWRLRVFLHGTEARPSFATPVAVVRDLVAHLPGDQVLVSQKQWPLAAFDHRDRRLHRLFVVAYAPRSDTQPSAQLGMFITAVREGSHGRWRLLEATTEPY